MQHEIFRRDMQLTLYSTLISLCLTILESFHDIERLSCNVENKMHSDTDL